MNYDERFRRTKIIATLGPASASEESVRAMILAGVNLFRINSSHGNPEDRAAMMSIVKKVRGEMGTHTGLIVDLQGPRIRVGELPKPLKLESGQEVVFAPEDDAGEGEIPTTYEGLSDDASVGSRILLDDGLLSVSVDRVSGKRVYGRVVHGGKLKSNKGMNLPDVAVSAPAVTEKDREDVDHAVENGADYIAVSFVRKAEDLDAVRSLVPTTMRLIAKIEKATALDDLDRIIVASDAVMVARGDLGVELPFEEVPLAQKHVIGKCMRYGRAVITATQMLESMVQNPRPTRAEASDVANAILDGTDAVMLSAETAVGEYPVEAVRAMARITVELEKAARSSWMPRRRTTDNQYPGGSAGVEDAIAVATGSAAELLNVPLILCFTKSGFTPRKISSYRPSIPIIGFSTESITCRQLSLVWGVTPELAEKAPNYETMLDVAREALLTKKYAERGDRIVVTAGVPFEVPGTTNLLKVEVV